MPSISVNIGYKIALDIADKILILNRKCVRIKHLSINKENFPLDYLYCTLKYFIIEWNISETLRFKWEKYVKKEYFACVIYGK